VYQDEKNELAPIAVPGIDILCCSGTGLLLDESGFHRQRCEFVA
jgi:hypothetical protein